MYPLWDVSLMGWVSWDVSPVGVSLCDVSLLYESVARDIYIALLVSFLIYNI